uniref:BHLH domain-containing protein n=1 Tax=Stomoxys calcitrans TaxID=35570 RepID=A0A1I8PD44_STOCA
MWHPALSTSNKPLQTELYANAALPPPPPMGAPDDISLANLVNLTKLHENELMAKPQTSSTATSHSMAASVGAANASPSTAAAAVAAAAAMYYNASNVLLQNSPLSLMAQLQQYMRNQVRTCPKSPAIPSTPWPATAIAEASNGHLLLAPSELAANGLMATRVTNSTLPLRCEDAIPSELVTSTRSASAPVNNSVIDLMPLDVLADTFIRLNALHLSQQTTTVTQTSLQPAVIQSPASSHSPSRGVGDDSFGSVAAAAAAAMLSMRTSPLPVNAAATAPAPSLAIVPAPPTTIPSPAFVHNNHPLFKPYFYMDSQQQYLNKVTAINALNASSIKTIPSARAASLPAYSDMHNYSSKPSLTGFKNSLSKNSLLRGSLCLPPRTSSKSPAVNCDLKRTLRKRSDHFLHKQKSPKSKSYDTSSLQGHRAEVSGDRELNEGEVDESLLPPPKKKWIRHYLNANHQMHVQNSNNGNHNHHSSNVSGSGSSNSNSMMVDDIPPTQQHSGGYATSTSSSISNSQHSPPRQGAGNHFIHMMNAAAASQQGGSAGGNPHVTPRRRTISSTSNGAGTREVHNKLEKNRRAHLKECYEALKNQLSLKDEDRRKTSNLAILGEALKCVQHYQKQKQELEAQWEHLANEKINKQKRIVFLKRELGPKYEQIFSGIFPDIEIGSIPSESDTITDVHSLSSGRGSTLYSSSSSLSSGGSNGSNSNGSSNAMSSPVGAGLQTAMPTAISPVITKINNNNNSNSSTSPISINGNNLMLQQQPQRKHPTTTIATTTIQAVAIPTQVVTGLGGGNTAGTATVTINGGGGGNNSPTAVSSNALVTFGGSTMPLSLTAKNISATAITRGSPTPSTPSPSPSSSSGVSSSSSLISSSPPINGVISNGRNVTVNIPNGLKLQAATVNGVTGTVIGNGATSAAATIIATSAPAQGVNNTNNAAALVNSHFPSQQQISGGRKKTLSLVGSSNNHHHGTDNAMAKNHQHHQHLPQTHHHKQTQNHQQSTEDGEQPAKLLKVFSGSGGIGVLSGMGVSSNPQREGVTATNVTSHAQTITHANNSLLGGSGDNSKLPPTSDKLLTNGFAAASSPFAASELCRLPGGAELNILPASSSTALNGIKIGGPNTNATTTTLATAFYHANGKITFTNNLPAVTSSAAATTTLLPSVSSSSTMPNRTTSTNGILLNGTDTSSVAPPPLLAAPPSGMSTAKLSSLHFPSNFAQLLAAANATSNNQTTTNTNTFVTSSNYGVHVSGPSNITNLTAMESPKSKSTIVGWRTGATTTN